jgi:HlyD family secretion protein
MKKAIVRIVILAAVAGTVWGGYKLYKSIPERQQQQIATTRVRRGDVVVRSYARGELRATRSIQLIAPNLFGTVQVTRLAPLGSFAHEKDLIVEFDDSEVNSRVEEKQLELDQIDEQIKKAEADLAVRNNQDQVDLLTAKFGVRRAELEVKRNDLLSAIDAKKNVLSLEEAKRRLQQLEHDIKSRQEQSEAQIAVFRANKAKGLLELSREKARLQQVRMLAPMTGLVAIRQNRPNFFFPGMQIPDIREGDQLNPGIPVAEVLDLSELEVLARVGELDRANLREGQEVAIQLDAIPGRRVKGSIKSMSGTATANVFSSDPAKKFDVVFALDMKQLFTTLGVKPERIQQILAVAEQNRKKPSPLAGPPPPAGPAKPGQPAAPGPPVPGGPQFTDKDLAAAKLPPPPEENSQFEVLLRPGLLADVEIIVEKLPNAIHIPVQAIFEKEGKLVAYVKTGNRFEERAFTPLKRSESTMVISKGLKEGEVVALADPTVSKDDKRRGKGGGGAMGGLPGGGGK